jgi:hypothetical protein
MPLRSLCNGCGMMVDGLTEGRCSECLPAYRALNARRREVLEPWRGVYATAEWKRCLRRARRRDGDRCRVVERDKRCEETEALEGHHHPESLRELYDRTQGWRAFVRLATDPSRVIMACPDHHARLDAARRRAAATTPPPAARERARRRPSVF